MRNNFIDQIDFFSTPDKPVDYDEYTKFRESLTTEEVWYYTTVSLA